MFADAIGAAMFAAFVAGCVAVLGAWGLWHFVLSHVRIGWV
jgi:hypothetical protein